MEMINGSQQTFTPEQIASICDHTFLKTVEMYRSTSRIGDNPIQQRQDDFYQFLKNTCESPIKPYGICVRAEDVPHARQYLDQHAQSKFILSATVGFPDGSWYKDHYKFMEAQYALSEGANEIDMPINWRALKRGDHGAVLEEIQKISSLIHSRGGVFKLILETSILDIRQIEEACHLAKHAQVDFIKTSTGFGPYGAQVEPLKLILKNFDGGVKISGGINLTNIGQFLEAIAEARQGVDGLFDPKRVRIGESELLETLSAGVHK